jgi:uncharacterized protein YjbI with pentapeptide repeats
MYSRNTPAECLPERYLPLSPIRFCRNHQIGLLILLQFSILQQNTFAADFSGANLTGAHLTNADLRGSNLTDANLTDANLSGTDLTGTNVTQRQLDTACGSRTKLPAGLTIHPCLDSADPKEASSKVARQ